MIKYILKRLWLALVTVFIILSITFILLKLLPFEKPIGTVDAQIQYYEEQVDYGNVVAYDYPVQDTGHFLDSFTSSSTGVTTYYYQVPVIEQYGNWIKNIVLHWDWGTSVSLQPNTSATTIIFEKLPVTIQINIVATLFAVPLGILLGIVSALRKNTKFDHSVQTGVMVFISIPSFVLISVLVLVLGYNFGWLPTLWPSAAAPLSTRILGFVIPVCALAFGSIAGYTRFVRAELCEVMSSEYLLLARTKGLTRAQAIKRHAFRNAMVPVFPMILAEIVYLLSGSIVLETLYGIPGIGTLFLDALNFKDYNVLFVNMAIFTTIGLVAGVLVDISYGFIDPRIRMGAKK